MPRSRIWRPRRARRSGRTPAGRRDAQRSADLRYRGQGSELQVEVPDGRLDAAAIGALRDAFHAAHERLYTYALPNAPIDLVNLRVTAMVPLQKVRPLEIPPQEGSVDLARVGERRVYFGPVQGAGAAGLGGSRLDGDAAL